MPDMRVTYYHESLPVEGVIVKNPAGWRNIVLSLERDQEFHTLVEYFKGNFMWYGNSREIVNEIESVYGLNTDIRVKFEVSFKINVWETLFEGLLKLDQAERQYYGPNENKILIPIVRDDFWSKFINRFDSQVDLQSDTDLDGGTRVVIPNTQLFFKTQVIRIKGEHFQESDIEYTEAEFSLGDVLSVSFDSNTLDEVEKINVESGKVRELQSMFTFNFSGKIDFDIRIRIQRVSQLIAPPFTIATAPFSNCTFYIQFNNEMPIEFSKESVTSPINYTDHTLSATYTRWAGDKVRIWALIIDDLWKFPHTNDSFIIFGKGFDGVKQTYLNVTFNTEFDNSLNDCYLPRESAESILSKITGRDNVLISDKFLNQYNWNAIFRGKHVRGYSFDQLPFSMCMKDWWEGFNPIFNLCMGYTKEGSNDKIYIEDKSHAYNPEVLVNISNASNLIRRYDLEKFFKQIDCGYFKWNAESLSGIDDPQTKQSRNTPLKNFGSVLTIQSRFVASSLAIERTRRNRVQLGKDDRMDEDIMIVSAIPSGSIYENEFGENFSAITNLLNPTKRVNLRHTPARLMRRWANVINPSFKNGDEIKIGKGEGNFKTTSTLSGTDFENALMPGVVDESGDYTVGGERLWEPIVYELSDQAMSWSDYKTIRDNKNNAIGLSRTNENHVPMFVLNLDFEIFGGKVTKMLLLQATNQQP